MTLRWYANRVANMRPAEIVHRVVELGRKTIDGRGRFGWDAFGSRGPLLPAKSLADRVRSIQDAELAAAIGRASDAVLEGRFEALGAIWPRRESGMLFPTAIWRLDPITQKLWPGSDRFTFDISYRHTKEFGDIKYVWEFNRMQFLQPLAAEVALTGRREAAQAMENAIESWVEANPPFLGLGWNSGIEVAMRAVSVALAVSLCADMLKPTTLAAIEAMLRAHHFWLRRYPSRYSSANNHLVAEALGEFVIEVLIPDLRGRSNAKRILEAEASKQIHADGVGAEQSPTYAAFVAEMFLTANLFASAQKSPTLASIVDERLASFADWICWLSDDRGQCPRIGDDDEGRVLTLAVGLERAYPASVARAAAASNPHARTWPNCAESPQLRDAFFRPKPAPPSPRGLRVFPDGGYTVVREIRAGRDMLLVLDHGPLGYLSIAAHGHADANAMTLSLDGEPIFVDPGTYLYHSGGPWRDAFRGTRAHNTLCLGNQDQSTISGPFNWSHKAKSRLLESRPGPLWLVRAAHDGYFSHFGVEHVREVRASDAGVDIDDSLQGAALREQVSIGFQLAPGLQYRGGGAAWSVLKGDLSLLRMEFSAPGRTEVSRGDERERRGWTSPAFGVKRPAEQLVWTGDLSSGRMITRVAWDR